MDDASLEEFVDASSEDERSESSESASGEGRPASGESSESASGEGRPASGESSESASVTGSDGDEPDANDEPERVAPAASTYAWTGDGAECVSCGESVERRWRDGDDLVCADCKEW